MLKYLLKMFQLFVDILKAIKKELEQSAAETIRK